MLFKSVFVVFVLLVLSVGVVSAEYRFKDGTKIEVQWYEKAGQILNENVCFNYQDDKRQYPQCRKKAVDYFKEECKFYKHKIKTTQQKYRQMYQPEMEKFCTAAETYKP